MFALRSTIERAFLGQASPRAAIKAMCLTCSHFDRTEIAHCAVNTCPLHRYRPFQSSRKPLESASQEHFSQTSDAKTIADTQDCGDTAKTARTQVLP